ncbi:MAG TPA: polysaccharide deacetylase family protein [Candidatus Cloacimonas sp.]|nr:polysaccharide deacetylase family protein [Candidatus Cloacimonas sp.]HQO18063.1 polysaccharide deacetylase family protein [Candidatus Cloacimonas sp.]
MKIATTPQVLYYHIVADKFPDIYPHGISVANFFKQMGQLQQQGYKIRSLTEILSAPSRFSGKDLALTFDDGFAVNYPVWMYLSKEYNIKPTLFLIGKGIDNQEIAWNHKLLLMKHYCPAEKLSTAIGKYVPGANIKTLFSRIAMRTKDEIINAIWKEVMPFSESAYLKKYKPYLSYNQLSSLYKAGVEFGLHSWSHPDFSQLTYPEAYTELDLCLQKMEELSIPCKRYFAYPYGRPASDEIETKLIKNMRITATFGISYKIGDNRYPYSRWQRTNMEGGKLTNREQFLIMPWLRSIKALRSNFQ